MFEAFRYLLSPHAGRCHERDLCSRTSKCSLGKSKSVNTTLSFVGPQHQTTTPTAASIPLKHPIVYPENVRIARVSSRYFRVTQPTSKVNPRVSFSIYGSKAFNVTEKGGIVHVINSTILKIAPPIIPLRLEWRVGDQPISSTTIKVDMTDVPPSKINICNQIEEIVHSCANAESRRDCESSCGVGGGSLKSMKITCCCVSEVNVSMNMDKSTNTIAWMDGWMDRLKGWMEINKDTYVGQCIWRSNNNSLSTQMSERYATCSPDLNFCPDYTCDELERLDARICPQDCTIESEVHFAEMNKGGRGIRSGLGMCSCNDMVQCTCGLESFLKVSDGGDNPLTTPIKEGNGKLKNDNKNKESMLWAQEGDQQGSYQCLQEDVEGSFRLGLFGKYERCNNV
ncbi:hypothetical protein HZH68_011677 [Vespula germanica]|uniref:RET cysteine rich domain-containing protein n=1 Tax=Vespula germanica TaxID=30212 RepID=A0A834MYB7_VESGE|nr:hypothetical protein HZH68_011677 [Vespula germanica]